MHCGSELLAYSYNNVTEDGGTLGIGCNLNRYDFLISYAKLGCCLGGEVNVALCSNYALGELKLCTVFGVNELAGSRSCDITALTNGSRNTDRTRVGERNLNLACISRRTENGYRPSVIR